MEQSRKLRGEEIGERDEDIKSSLLLVLLFLS
jgi:hypothetical protein